MNNNDTNLSVEHYDPSFSNIERFEAAQNWVEFDCRGCNDTGYDYNDAGDKVLCTCDAGTELAQQDEEIEPFDRDGDDEGALSSAGWGTDESYSYEEWN
jgi:hypothetical protein